MRLLILGAILFARTTLSASSTPSAFSPLATTSSNHEYNHDVAPVGENHDPRFADPWGRIKCYGPMPPFNISKYYLPTDGSLVNPNNWTLQQLCAKPQYGGKGEYQHLGGFCQRYTELDSYYGGEMAADSVRDNDHYRPFAFDSSIAARPMPYSVTNPRLFQFCQQRCFCSAWATESTITPPEMIYVQLRPAKITFSESHLVQAFGSQLTPVSLDSPYGKSDGLLSYIRRWDFSGAGSLVTYMTTAMVQAYGRQTVLQKDYAENPGFRGESFGYHINQTIFVPPIARYRRSYTTLSPANEIICDGDTPEWHWWNKIGPYESWNMTQQTFWQTVNATTPPIPDRPADFQSAAPFPVLGPVPPVFPFQDRSQLPITNLQQLCANSLSGGNP